MALHIIIGYPPTGGPKAVYVGDDAEAARRAREADKKSDRHECFHNPLGLRKANPDGPTARAAAKAAAEAAAAAEAEAEAAAKAAAEAAAAEAAATEAAKKNLA